MTCGKSPRQGPSRCQWASRRWHKSFLARMRQSRVRISQSQNLQSQPRQRRWLGRAMWHWSVRKSLSHRGKTPPIDVISFLDVKNCMLHSIELYVLYQAGYASGALCSVAPMQGSGGGGGRPQDRRLAASAAHDTNPWMTPSHQHNLKHFPGQRAAALD